MERNAIPETTTANITPKPLTAVVTADSKVYNKTTDATVNATVSTGVTGENLTISGLTGTFADENVANDIVVTVNKQGVQVTPGTDEDETLASNTVYPYVCSF